MPPAGLASCMHVSSKKQEKRNTSGNCNERWRLKAGAMTAVQVWGEKRSRSKGDSEPKWVNTKGVNLIVTANCGHWPSSVMITSWVVFPDLGTSPSALSLTERKTGIWILRLLTKQKAVDDPYSAHQRHTDPVHGTWPVMRSSCSNARGASTAGGEGLEGQRGLCDWSAHWGRGGVVAGQWFREGKHLRLYAWWWKAITSSFLKRPVFWQYLRTCFRGRRVKVMLV